MDFLAGCLLTAAICLLICLRARRWRKKNMMYRSELDEPIEALKRKRRGNESI